MQVNNKIVTKLERTKFDKLGAVVLFLLALLLFVKDYSSYGIMGKIIWCVICIVFFINAVFILTTPIIKLKDTQLYLYAEVQPIVFALSPSLVDIKHLLKLEISRGVIEFRAIFP